MVIQKNAIGTSDRKNHQIGGFNSRIFYGNSGGSFEGVGLLTICSSRVGAYWRGGFVEGEANSRIYGMSSDISLLVSAMSGLRGVVQHCKKPYYK